MSSSTEVELDRVKSEINARIQAQIRRAGKQELYLDVKSKESTWDDISNVLQHGSTSPSMSSLFFSSGLAPWKTALGAIALLLVYFKWWNWSVLLWVGIGACIHAVVLTLVRRKADGLFSHMNDIEKEAQSELLRTDNEFAQLLEHQKELEEIKRNEYAQSGPVYTSPYASSQRNQPQRSHNLVCSQCGKVHGELMSVANLWHQCNNCGKVYCDTCGSRLSRDMLMPVGVRKCACGTTTTLVSF